MPFPQDLRVLGSPEGADRENPGALSPAAASGRGSRTQPRGGGGAAAAAFASAGNCAIIKPSCFVAEVSGIKIQVCGRGAARGVLHPLCLVAGVRLGRRPVLEPTGHPAVHHGL